MSSRVTGRSLSPMVKRSRVARSQRGIFRGVRDPPTTMRDPDGPSPARTRDMNYNRPHRFYCGVDLHARTLFTHVLDHKGKTVFEQDLPADPAAFLKAIKPYRKDVVVGCECMFAWYWLADLCEAEGISFALGHALGMRLIHGDKTKTDRHRPYLIGSRFDRRRCHRNPHSSVAGAGTKHHHSEAAYDNAHDLASEREGTGSGSVGSTRLPRAVPGRAAGGGGKAVSHQQ